MTSPRIEPVQKLKVDSGKIEKTTLKINTELPIQFFELPRLVSELYNLWAISPQPVIKNIFSKKIGQTNYPFTYAYEFVAEPKPLQPETKESKSLPAASLASILMISRFLRQAKLEERHCFVNHKTNAYENWNHTFALEWWKEDPFYKEVKVDLTQSGIENLLEDKEHAPLEWLGIKYLTITRYLLSAHNAKLTALEKHADFKLSAYLTLFKILLTPKKVFQFFVSNTIHDERIRKLLLKKLLSYQKELWREALIVKNFREFLYTQPETKPEFTLFLEQFDPVIKAVISEQATSITTEAKLEEYILDEDSAFDIDYQKKLLKEMMIDKINRLEKIEDIITLIDQLTSDETYKNLKDRHKFSGFSFLGLNHFGQPISATLSEVIGFAKKRIVDIAKATENTDYEKYWPLLSSHRTTSWFGSEPLLNLFKCSTSSIGELEKEKDLKDEFELVKKI